MAVFASKAIRGFFSGFISVMRGLLFIFVLTGSWTYSLAQTCCSSGVPIASNLGFQPQGEKVLQLSLVMEYNHLSTLYDGRTVLDDDRRLRTTTSALTRLAYGLHRRVQIEMLVPYVNQTRTVVLNNGGSSMEVSRGLGDITSLVQFVLIENAFSNVSLGGGVKFPTGANDLRNSQGLLLINDLQTGSNTYDYLFRLSSIRNLTLRPSVSFFLHATTILRTKNEEYLNTQTYRFGNELQINLGYSDQIFVFKTLAYPTLSLRWRQALSDHINGNILDNTGGSWLFGRGGIGMDVFKGHRLSISGEYPLFTKVEGTQLSPDYIINVSYYKALDFRKSEF